MAAYCTTDDLLLGDLVVGRSVSPETYVNAAADEMNSKLGFIYKVPIEPNSSYDPPFTVLATHEKLLLKDINVKLASGRLILAQAQGSEDGQEHAYGASLIRDALNSLYLLTSREVILSTAAPADNTTLLAECPAPSIHNADDESLLLGFEETVMRSNPWWSRPGAV